MAFAKVTYKSSGGGTMLGLNTILGAVFIVMALLQAISFSSFKEALTLIGLPGPTFWAVVLIVLEVLAAVGLVGMLRDHKAWLVSAGAAVLASGFWLFEMLQVITAGKDVIMDNSGFFGKYLPQRPGWWTVVEASILLFWVLGSIANSRER